MNILQILMSVGAIACCLYCLLRPSRLAVAGVIINMLLLIGMQVGVANSYKRRCAELIAYAAVRGDPKISVSIHGRDRMSVGDRDAANRSIAIRKMRGTILPGRYDFRASSPGSADFIVSVFLGTDTDTAEAIIAYDISVEDARN